MSEQAHHAAAAGEREWPPAAKAWWATMVFFLLYILSFVDRQMLNLLVEPIKKDLGLSDVQVSLLQGLTFAAFYTVFGLLAGWLVDNGPRRSIIAVGVVLWSAATAVCGLASQFWQLSVGRMAVAVGEASLAPAAYSLLSDLFPPRRLALPMSVMGAGAAVGGAIALVVGGMILSSIPPQGISLPILGVLAGWQVAFLLVCLPGLLLSPLIYTVTDPGRRKTASGAATSGSAIPCIKSSPRFYLGHYLGFGLFSLINYGVTSWLPTFMIRRHGWDISQAGYTIGLIMFIVGPLGAIAMGYMVDRWFARGRHDAHLIMYAVCCLVQLGSIALVVNLDNPWLAIACLVPQVAVAGFTGVAATALQIATPPQVRGQVSAIYLLVFNLLGLGLGPTLVALFTDHVFADEARVGDSLLLVHVIFAPLAAFLMVWAAPAMRARLAELEKAAS